VGYESYELDKATRPIADFIDDVSVWYLRRSRERLKSDDTEDKALALGTLRFILRELAKVMAPAMPFYAEYLYLAVRDESEAESVHLTKWSAAGEVDFVLLQSMESARNIVTTALEARTKANIKVRQPLEKISVTIPENVVFSEELRQIVADELNVKHVELTYSVRVEAHIQISAHVVLDTTLTPELITEGAVRELMRAIQDMRKASNLTPADLVTLIVTTDAAGEAAISSHHETILRTVNATALNFGPTEGTAVEAGEYRFVVSFTK
jgi:isoleucyl-tRNA synthetase